jgi:hypothetical protein
MPEIELLIGAGFAVIEQYSNQYKILNRHTLVYGFNELDNAKRLMTRNLSLMRFLAIGTTQLFQALPATCFICASAELRSILGQSSLKILSGLEMRSRKIYRAYPLQRQP